MHVPDRNLEEYRRLMGMARILDRRGNQFSNQGGFMHGFANRAWAAAAHYRAEAQKLRVPGRKERLALGRRRALIMLSAITSTEQ